jgi:hypothetical protein
MPIPTTLAQIHVFNGMAQFTSYNHSWNGTLTLWNWSNLWVDSWVIGKLFSIQTMPQNGWKWKFYEQTLVQLKQLFGMISFLFNLDVQW